MAIDPSKTGHRWLLIRRSRRTSELAFYRCYSPRYIPLPALQSSEGAIIGISYAPSMH